MKRLKFTTSIKAPSRKVWNALLQDSSYREWTAEFMPGSYYEGSWDEGSRICFKSAEGNGMISRIVENKPYEVVSIEHQGILNKGREDFDSEESRKWKGALEIYRLKEANGHTTLSVEQDISDDYFEYFNTTWPKALARIRKIAET